MTELAVLVSGTGSILEAMMKELPITLVVADRPCRGFEIARAAQIYTNLIDRREFGYPNPGWDRGEFSLNLALILRRYDIDLVAMAGFMTILDKAIFDSFEGRILNTHPSLLPAFKGENAVADALAAGVKVTGCTIHIATIELDSGPILAQEPVRVLPDDTKDTLHERIKTVERILYTETIKGLMKDG